jgi:hypothetical protein
LASGLHCLQGMDRVAQSVALSTCLFVPAFLAVSAASLSRPFARLSAMAPSVGIVSAGAAALAAVSAAAQLSALPDSSFLLIAPPWIGAAPWAAGELVAGPSRRQDESFAAAVIAAYLAGLAALCLCGHFLCLAVAAAAAATAGYLLGRGGKEPA